MTTPTKFSLLFSVSFFLFAVTVNAQNVGINTTGATPSANAILDLNTGNSNNAGLIVPSVTLGASLATFSPPMVSASSGNDIGMLVYNSGGVQPVGYYFWNGGTWVSISGAASSVTAANDGTSLNGTNVILGNSYGGTLGKLTQNTELPFNGKNLTFSNVGGGGNLGIDLAASTSAAQALEIGQTTNTIRINGLKAGASFNLISPANTDYLLYSNANGDLYSIPAGTTGYILTQTASGPQWQATTGATVTGANDGTSLNGTNVIMGNAYGGTTGELTQNTELPFNGKNLTFSNAGGAGNIGIDLAASTSAARALEIGQTTNTIRVNGLKSGSTFNATPAAATSYIMYSNTNGDMYSIPAGTTGYVLTQTATGPIWQALAGAIVTGANDGASLNGTNVILGNAYGGTTGQLTQNTELPFNGKNLTLSNVGGGGNLGIDLAASTSAAQALEIGQTTNTIRINGLKAGASYNLISPANTDYMIYANANGDLYSIPTGTTGNVLTQTVAGPQWQAGVGANDGTSMNGNNVILGNSFGGTLGQLTQNTELPFNGKNLTFSNVGGGGNIGIDLAASTSAAQALEIGQTTNTIRVNGLKAGSTYNANPASATSYIMYSNTNGDMYSIPAGTTGYVLTQSAIGPQWQALTPATVTAANDGTSLNGTTVILGNSFGGTLGELTQNTELPFNGKNLTLSNVGGGGNLGIDLAASTSAAQALEIGQTTNTIRINGLKAGASYNLTSPANTDYLVYANTNGDLYSIPNGTTGYVLTQTASGPQWQSGGAASADNGLSIGSFTAGKTELGGTTAAPAPLLGNSVISGSGFNLDFDLGTYTAGGTGSFLVTNGGLANPSLSVTSSGVGVNINPAVSTLDDNGSFGTQISSTVITAAVTLNNTYHTVLANPSGGAFTITLPAPGATNIRREYTITYAASAPTTNFVTVASATANTIITSGSLAVSSFAMNGGSVTLQSNGTDWYVVSSANIFDVPFSSGGFWWYDNTTNYWTGTTTAFSSVWEGIETANRLSTTNLAEEMTQTAENTGTLASPTFTSIQTYWGVNLGLAPDMGYFQYIATSTSRLVSVNLSIEYAAATTMDFEVWKYPAASNSGVSFVATLTGGVVVASNTALSLPVGTDMYNFTIPGNGTVVNPGDIFVIWVKPNSNGGDSGIWSGTMQFQSFQ